jgi:hypothetical protein
MQSSIVRGEYRPASAEVTTADPKKQHPPGASAGRVRGIDARAEREGYGVGVAGSLARPSRNETPQYRNRGARPCVSR